MFYYTYMLKCISAGINKSYVGYTNNLELRLSKHNSNKGAKSTKGYKWIIIYSKKFKTKNKAMSFEYQLKKDKIFRKELLKNYNK
ncbi:GIY-YIG nuclease family protein [Candidatus Pelagibacter bacterium]|jgi:putative endonuclease|nr:GIY-YIG nuclease family protein [Candidatus Pelagibacter sp.]MDB2486033.1 GIY-YIG nuclease family protein [Candidatus Pelagibacter bacterium]